MLPQEVDCKTVRVPVCKKQGLLVPIVGAICEDKLERGRRDLEHLHKDETIRPCMSRWSGSRLLKYRSLRFINLVVACFHRALK